MPDDFILIDVETDSWYQDYYVNKYSRPTSDQESWMFLYFLGRRSRAHKTNFLFDDPCTSPLLKSARFALVSYAKDEKYCIHTHLYLAEFHRRANDALQSGDVQNLVYSLYFMALFSLVSGEAPAAIQVNSLQFARAVDIVVDGTHPILDESQITIESMWNYIIGALFAMRTNSIWDLKTHFEMKEDSRTLVEHGRRLVPKDIRMWALSHSSEKQTFVKLATLANLLTPQLSTIDFHAKYSQDAVADGGLISELINEIDLTMEQFLQLCTMMPPVAYLIREAVSFGFRRSNSRNVGLGIDNFDVGDLISKTQVFLSPKYRDLALCYCLVSLARALIRPDFDLSDVSTSGVVGWAFAICYLSESLWWRHSDENIQVVVRGLLWSGIILTKQRCPAGEHSLLTLLTSL